MIYGNRHGTAQRPPSGGTLTKPILGMGKLPPGTYQAEVLSLVRGDAKTTIIVQAHNGHCHAETVVFLPPTISTGSKLTVTIEPHGGFILVRDGGRYQAREIDGTPLCDWRTDLAELWQHMLALKRTPATTAITEVVTDDGPYKPQLYTAEAAGAASGSPAADPATASQ